MVTKSATTKTVITLKEGSNQISLKEDFKSPKYSRRVTSSWNQEPLNLQEWLIFVYRQKRKPHFISKVSRLIDKYKDREYVLIENIMKKYRIKEKDLPVPILRTLRNQKKRNYGTECWNEAVEAQNEKHPSRKSSMRREATTSSIRREATTMPTKRAIQHSRTPRPSKSHEEKHRKPRVTKLKRRASPIKITRSRRRSFDPMSASPVSLGPVHASACLVNSATVSAAPSLQPSAGTPRKDSTPDPWEEMHDSGSNEDSATHMHISSSADVAIKALTQEIAQLRRITETTQRKVDTLAQHAAENKRLRKKIKLLEQEKEEKENNNSHKSHTVKLDGIWCQDEEEIECKSGKLPFGELVLGKPVVSWQNNGVVQCQGEFCPEKRSIIWDDGTEWFWQDPNEHPNFGETLSQLDMLRENIRNSRSRRNSSSSIRFPRRSPRKARRRYSDDSDEKCVSTSSPIESRI